MTFLQLYTSGFWTWAGITGGALIVTYAVSLGLSGIVVAFRSGKMPGEWW